MAQPMRDKLGSLDRVRGEAANAPGVHLDREVLAKYAERNLYGFVRAAWPIVQPRTPFVDNWHIGCICEHLQALTELQIRKLVINIPPRHMKSLLVSVFWFCWSWLRLPSSQWVYLSYDDSLLDRDSNRCRDVVRSPWFQDTFGQPFVIRPDVDAKDLFRNTEQGSRITTTPEGRGTGLDADFLVADDANSVRDLTRPSRLETVNNTWGGVLATRGNDPKTLRRCITQQRVAEKDLSGHVIASELGYEHLCIPFEYEPKRYFPGWAAARDAKERHPIVPTALQKDRPHLRDPRVDDNQVLWPERYGTEEIRDLKAEMIAGGGTSAVASQLQQRPSPEQGTTFQRDFFRYYEHALMKVERKAGHKVWHETVDAVRLESAGGEELIPYEQLRFFQCIDTAMTRKHTSSYTCVGTFAFAPGGRMLVWDVWRGRLEIPYQFAALEQLSFGPCRWDDAGRRMVRLIGFDGAEIDWPAPLILRAIENKASGVGLIQQAEMEGRPFRVLSTGTEDKVFRSNTVSSMYYTGRVFHRRGAHWLPDYETELLGFPSGAHDDQVDVTSYAGILLTSDALLRGHQARQGQLTEAAVNSYVEAALAATGNTQVTVRGEVVDVLWEDD